ncbi:hypothetical protein B0H10DRAFT_2244900 [Mycena sp. CBHHK59/15]|nr:hypothetical protein B0H10DRAFT_2244900 [Mycena sp. CBHHK59/15]
MQLQTPGIDLYGLWVLKLGPAVDRAANDPDWIREAICDSFTILPLLSDLQLKTQVQIVQDMYQVVGRSHDLASLHLSGSGHWSKIWTLLRATLLRPSASARIHLKELTTSFVTPDILAYLSSYSGVESISLERSQGGSRPKPDPLADTIFDSVLAPHANSLVELSCPACCELEKLHMSVNPQDVAPPMNAVTLLLTTAALLPALRLLKIPLRPTEEVAEESVKTSIENFTSHLESAAIVCTGEDFYELAPAVSDEPGERSTILAYRILDPTSSLDSHQSGLRMAKKMWQHFAVHGYPGSHRDLKDLMTEGL